MTFTLVTVGSSAILESFWIRNFPPRSYDRLSFRLEMAPPPLRPLPSLCSLWCYLSQFISSCFVSDTDEIKFFELKIVQESHKYNE
jgi:hypothetical protein